VKQNLIIRASAGTGKTFSLATRFLRLMLFQDAKPERILALTFSRAAAREIYQALLRRLWRASADDGGAARERAVLLDGLDEADKAAVRAKGVDFSRASFTSLLRRVLASQSAGTIATLDSFILRIVRAFPLETGFQNAVDVLDDFGGERAANDACTVLLGEETASPALENDFALAAQGRFARSGATTLADALAGWRDFRLACRGACDAWTAGSMLRALGVGENTAKPTGGETILPTVGGNNAKLFAAFLEHLDTFTPAKDVFPDKGCGEMALFFVRNPAATVFAFETKGGDKRAPQRKVCDCGEAGAAFVRRGVAWMVSEKLARAVAVVRAKLDLVEAMEKTYDKATRRQGRLTFSDFTDAVAEREGKDPLQLANLQFRFDAAFDHWALDEFQDTSVRQWECLRQLVRSAAQEGGGRTVMAVGDLKQSIYTWRGGNDEPFTAMMGWAEFADPVGEIRENAVSRRYGANTVAFVNRVFGPENVRDDGILGEACAPAVSRWLAENCWMEHVADPKRPLPEDSVEVIAVPKPPKGAAPGNPADDPEEADAAGAAMKILSPALCRYVAGLWERHERAGSLDTVGILVRDNKDGLALAERLRAMPGSLPVVWEGADGILDSPAVHAVLELLKLADHPEDSFSWQVVNGLLPVRELVFPQLSHREKVSAAVARLLERRGLARTIQFVVAKLAAAPEALRLDARSLRRLRALLRESVAWEARAEEASGVADFTEYLASTAGRETASSPHVIRILTIHRAKGLTIDHVVVPVLEAGKRDAMARPRGNVLADVAAGWAVEGMKEEEALACPALREAWEKAANERVLEQLRLHYVALTRARKSTCVFLVDPASDPHEPRVQFRDLLVAPFGNGPAAAESPYGRVVCRLGPEPHFAPPQAVPPEEGAAWEHAAGDTRVPRRSPSDEKPAGRGFRTPAAPLFAREETAAERGEEMHAKYAAIGWIDPDAPKDDEERAILASDWREAFVRPADGAVLWREKRYERLADGAWETGQFDRVVFAGTGEERRATVYDFKSNRRREGESAGAFAERMRETYAGQMHAYREAVAALAGLEKENVRAVLLLADAFSAVEAGEERGGTAYRANFSQ
jgi:ATP-dependent exoDNAse (exonuclease V) beta subunit